MNDERVAVKGVLEGVATQAAHDQLRLAQQALAQLRESVVITDTHLNEPGPKIVYVNTAFTKMTGWFWFAFWFWLSSPTHSMRKLERGLTTGGRARPLRALPAASGLCL